ncbi:hypothetical protein GV792_08160 [Nocardia cyriacigeorgica]|uniref:hypothetical protein n=1 Tax=Nocardia cyriacigeorgica TaxID=135487 RepID=UPI0013B900B1|nr:hypothetical protein [Nocardia cyriacigeorgica]NEW39538.1 hypothetical protein [Nocardia cyriacigeorgica]NEW50027.1 hypothetical protein [Nocardia cyriacigeorgica]
MADHAEPEGLPGDTDPAYAPEREHFIGYTHQEIWDRVHEVMDPALLDRAAAVWRANAVALGEAFRVFGDATNREFARWSGHTADAAARATGEFVHAGTDTHEVCAAVAALLELDRDAAQTVRAAIPPPQPYCPLDDPAAEAIHGGQRRMDHDIAAAAVTADVQDLMTHVYSPAIPASGDRVPRFAVTRTDPTGGGGLPL